MSNDHAPDTVTAALLVIGEEILSGRTRDENVGYIAAFLTRVGIALRELRVVADEEADIAEAVNALRRRYAYVFTTGGIGPTHDDITTDAIARAFGVNAEMHEEAVAAMRQHYAEDQLTPARLRMARIPDGAELIHNAISRAPGYKLQNVIVMAGIPRVMQVMLDEVAPRLSKGRPVMSRAVRVDAAESEVAPPLAALQAAHPDVQMGSYPFFEKNRLGTHLVIRAADEASLDSALRALWDVIAQEGFDAGPVDDKQ